MKPKHIPTKNRRELLNKFAYAEYMVEDGCPRKDFLSKDEIDHLLMEYLDHLIATNQVKRYQLEE